MIRKVVFTITVLVLFELNSFAQSFAEEALMLSRTLPGGTARISAMGGVQGALGGDISAASYNPAGLGLYNRSELVISPSLAMNGYTTGYLGNSVSESTSQFSVPSLGVVFHNPSTNPDKIFSGSFSITYTRINNFNNTFTYRGTNNDNSIVDYFIQDANGADSSQFNPGGFNYNSLTRLAYDNYMIGPANILDPSNPKDEYFTDVSGIPFQTETVKTRGSQNRWSLAYGMNFNDKFYLGASLGLVTFDYTSDKTYKEEFSDAGQPMSQMTLQETLKLSGTGFNFTFGAIFRPVEQVLTGLSVSTPTAYQITDNYSANMASTWRNFEYVPGLFLNNLYSETDTFLSNYNLSTPWRVTGSFTYFFQKYGFISADAEWINYGSSEYSASVSGDNYSADNAKIKGLFKSVFNIRVGGEYRWNKYRFRAGYNVMPDPYQTEQNKTSITYTAFTTGVGYKAAKFSVDLAANFGGADNTYRPYTINSTASPLVSLNQKQTSLMLTFGFTL